ncbi:MAG: NADPH-dependent 7-cyano-7-deazaguanine reductase QueF [Proteobacteria bacterium]|nr:NADPH-dependent 7-cyano-7-deazaguanine reductase QueF [Pseudomonadota bacterium]
MHQILSDSLLGKQVSPPKYYNKNLLFRIKRFRNLESIIYGIDVWIAYEVYWLNQYGKPNIRIAEVIYDAHSKYIVESKSLKMYLNSFNNSIFIDELHVKQTIENTLSDLLETPVKVNLYNIEDYDRNQCHKYFKSDTENVLLDSLESFACTTCITASELKLLDSTENLVTESLITHCLRSNCPVTGQPDFGSLRITYYGKKIHQKNLILYISSIRNKQEFHEQCADRIFFHIMHTCKPIKILLEAAYTRRGGISINPIRSNFKELDYSGLSIVR